ncbi:TetR/AcrR family transcriptional regulator [Haloactinomyces albus]|uniref:AcrR family transcriptional regulator n=1 Tax=Haloactinomyces albus TaxID=1352928 RepID=A0AAE3ZJ11_9ACTN|nr:TetR family transcriptional regulator C-terminal domain-containing protein [Haloactinomyces albus]MDR7304087.1 AcrR family transcriptional regulator [Haloactinomyces albus]
MPRLVDHDARRRELIRAALRITARSGLEAATMREIAAEAGVANGALAHYFRDKDELLMAAYQHIFDETNRRAATAIGEAHGLTALRRLCREIMPMDDERVDEARVAVSFWGRAAHNPEMSALHEAAMAEWRSRMLTWLRQNRDSGESTLAEPDERIADKLLAAMMGLQVNVLMAPASTTPDRQVEMLESILGGPLPVQDDIRTGSAATSDNR